MININLCLVLIGVAAVCSAREYDEHNNHQASPPYQYEYGVHDAHTGDIKEAKESGDGHGGVKGYYKLKEADGTQRIVHYTADKHQGFIAHVDKVGQAHHLAGNNHHEPQHYESHHGIHAWANQPHHYNYNTYSSHYPAHQGDHYPHYQVVPPVHKFDLHHDKHHGTSHQYVSLHH